MRTKNPITLLIGWLALASVLTQAAGAANDPSGGSLAYQTGVISGQVSNATTHAFLPGARVEVEGTGRVVLTEGDGGFRIANLPPGELTLNVSYTDLDPQKVQVTVSAGRERVVEVLLTSATPPFLSS